MKSAEKKKFIRISKYVINNSYSEALSLIDKIELRKSPNKLGISKRASKTTNL
jgi:hypothetical protein